MPIMYVNPAGHGKRAKGRARVGTLRSNPMAKRKNKKRRGRRTAAKLGHARRRRRLAAPKRRVKRRKVARKSAVRRRRRRAAKKGWKGRRFRKAHPFEAGNSMKGPRRPSTASRKRYSAARAAAGASKRKPFTHNPAKRRRRGRKAAARLGHARKRRHHRRIGRTARRYRVRKGRHVTHAKARRKARRRYKRNPSMAGILALIKRALPVLGSILVGKLIQKQIVSNVSQVSSLGQFQGPVLAGALLVGAQIASSKVSFLRAHQDEIMLGLGINLLTEVISAFAPASVKTAIGMGGIYDRALSDYVQTSDYLTTSDYVSTGMDGIEQELGMSQELGLSQELGEIPGGLSQSALVRSVPPMSFSGQIPNRSFTSEIEDATSAFDSPGGLYAGVFRGGF
jgi:hypothetical protein